MFVLCVVQYRQTSKCRTLKTNKQVRMKYKHSTREYKKKIRVGARFFASLQIGSENTPSLIYNGYRVIARVKAAGAWR